MSIQTFFQFAQENKKSLERKNLCMLFIQIYIQNNVHVVESPIGDFFYFF